jgi:aminoglycoside 6-adenylyltransferase
VGPAQNVAKGIWRDELPYAKGMFEDIIRRNLDDMVRWWIGIKQGFEVSTGKMGKYFKHYLPERYWTMYERTLFGQPLRQFLEFYCCDMRTVSNFG